MENPVYLHKVECHCVVCGKTGEKFLLRDGVEDQIIPDEFTRFCDYVVCRKHVMELRRRRPEGKDIGYEDELWADGKLTDIKSTGIR